MPQNDGLTLEEALALGGKPSDGLTLEQALALGGKPAAQKPSKPLGPIEYSIPGQTTGSALRELAIGALEPLTIPNIAKSLAGLAGIFSPATMDILHYQPFDKQVQQSQEAVEGIGTGLVQSIVGNPIDYVRAIREGDSDKAANTAGHIISETLPIFYGAARGVQAAKAAKPTATGVVRKMTTLNPQEAAAVKYAATENIPIRASVATGNRAIGAMEAGTEGLPYFSNRGKLLSQATADAMARKGTRLAKEAGGALSKEAAGNKVIEGLEAQVEGYSKLADAAYGKARKAAAANVQPVQVGTEIKTVLENGAVVQKRVPVFKDIASPVDYKVVKSSLRPLLEELEVQIPEAQRQASPGLSALRNIMAADDVVPLSKALDDLSAIQNISRTDLPLLRSKAQGIAAAVTKPLREAVDVSAGQSGALDALNSGRDLIRKKYEVGDLLRAVKDREPVRIVETLTAQGDRSIQQLRDIAKAAPETAKDIGTSTLQGIMDEAMNEGTFKGAKAFAQWQRLGPETKKILFTPEHAAELEKFFDLAKMSAKDFNPSGSGKLATLSGWGYLTVTNPAAGVATVISADVLTRLLYKPNWAKLVVAAMRTPKTAAYAPSVNAALLAAAQQVGKGSNQ